MAKSKTQYKFGQFQLDPLKRVLLYENTPVQLPSRAFDVLMVLVERNQTVIDKEELMQLVWGERVVEENNLTRHISTLRKILDESPNDHRYIVTVPGRGYSFVAEVEKLPTNGGPDDSARAPTTELAQPEPSKSSSTKVEFLRFLSSSRSHKRWVPLTALVLVLTCIGLFGFVRLGTRAKRAAENSYRNWEVLRLTRTGGSFLPTISPDGRFVAYVDGEPGQESVWILQLATSARQQIVPPETCHYFDLEFSSDGNELFFTRREGKAPQRALYRMPMLGGVPQKIREDVDSLLTVSPDGSHLAFARLTKDGRSEFVIANVAGGDERVLLEHGLQFPQWSPDGKVIAYSVGDAGTGADRMSLHEVRVTDGAKKEISAQRWVFIGNKSWLPDGSGLIVTAREWKANVTQLWFVSYPSGEAHQISEDFDDFTRARLTSDGRVMVAGQMSSVSHIWSGPLTDTSHVTKIGVWGRAGVSFLSGGHIVYSSLQSGEVPQIWMMNVDGTGPKQLTTDGANDISPVASPDGRYVIFCSNRSGNHEIWRVNADGAHVVQLTHTTGATFPTVSPDGRWVIYRATADSALYKIPIEGGEPQRVAGNAVGVSAVSPDGKMIAYFTQGKETWDITVSFLQTGLLTKTLTIGSHSLNNGSLKWTPDGKALLYSSNTNGIGNIWQQPLDGSPSIQVTDFKEDGIFSFDVSRDGKELICARGGWKHDVVLVKNLRS